MCAALSVTVMWQSLLFCPIILDYVFLEERHMERSLAVYLTGNSQTEDYTIFKKGLHARPRDHKIP